MLFNQRNIFVMVTLWGSVAITACGSAGNTAPRETVTRQAIGAPPTFYSSAFSASAVDANFIVATDDQSLSLNEFTLEPFARTRSVQLPFDTLSQQVISDDNRKWFIVVSGADYAVIRENGSHVVNPVEVQGQIAGIAVDGVSDTVVITDNFGSMALLQLSPVGDVLNSWISGPMLKDNAVIQSAAMLANGKLVAALAGNAGSRASGETTIVLADIGATIKAAQWSLREFKVKGISDISWMAATSPTSQTVLVRGSSGIALIDTESDTVADHILLDANRILGVWRDKDPHVIATPDATNTTPQQLQQLGVATRTVEIYYAGPELKIEKKTVATSQGTIENSWLESKSDRITTIASNNPSDKYALRYRLSDNLITSAVKLPGLQTRIALAPDYIFVQYESSLGFAERWGYGRSQPKLNLTNYGLRSIMARQ